MTNNYYQKSKEKLQKDVRERYTQKKRKKWKRSHNKNLFEEQKKKLAEYRSII